MDQIRQVFLWIALLAGVSGGANPRARLSVFVSPRLRAAAGEDLGSFPDFVSPGAAIPNWAARMHPDLVSFAVEVEGEASVPATIVSTPPDPVLWDAAFGPETPVATYQFDDYADRPLVTFPVRRILDYVRNRYVAIATRSPSELPTHEELARGISEGDEGFGELLDAMSQPSTHGGFTPLDEATLSRNLAAAIATVRDRARERRAAHAGVAIGPGDGEALVAGANGGGAPEAFGQAMLFHYRPAAAEPVPLPESESEARETFEETVDFHQMLSALGDYPALLRRLGLVFDLELPVGDLPLTNGGPPRRLRVIPSWTSSEPAANTSEFSPWTVFVHEDDPPPLLTAASRTGETTRGFWTPPAADIDVVQVDPDGAALKTINTVLSLGRLAGRHDHLPIDAPERAGVASLRTDGLSLARAGHAAAMNDGFNIAHNLMVALESGDPLAVELFAEDLTRGCRVDVWDGVAGTWRSLHERLGAYRFLELAGDALTIEDEGQTQLSITEPAKAPTAPPDPDAELYVHESLLTWNGWSHSAPRPGKSISRSPRAPDENDEETQPQRVPNTAMTKLRLETSFRPQPASLPRLRFGRDYALRARTVDLAGNSLTLAEADQYLDVLPGGTAVFPASGLLYSRFEPVASPVLVRRADYGEGESLERLVIRSNHDATAEEYAAAHPESGYAAANDRHVAAPKASLALVESHGLLDAALDAKNQGLPPDAVAEEVRKVYELALKEAGSLVDPADPTGDPIHAEDQLVLPYLPDPLAPGVVLQGLPDAPAETLTTIRYGAEDWHDALPFRIRLVEGRASPAWDEDARVLTIALPKATMATVRFSSMFGGDLRLMGLWQWIEQAFNAGEISAATFDELIETVQSGRHWMFTPFRDVTFVHAVQQPLQAPVPETFDVARRLGNTFANLSGDLTLHIPSTAKVDLHAAWTEPRDDPALGDPDTLFVQTTFMEIPVATGPDWGDLPSHMLTVHDEERLHFNTDTQFRDFDVIQTIRAALAANPPQGERVTLQAQLDVLSKLTPHEFGDTKYRRVTYQLSATSRFREYFSPAIAQNPSDQQSMARLSETFERDILSSARPAPPKIHSVLPTFAWETEDEGAGRTTSVRRGNGLRVYVQRPWFSSGDGELLGVIFGSAVPSPLSRAYPYATYLGQDPIWRSLAPRSPRPANFPLAVAVAEGIDLPELALGGKVSVAGHTVEFDQDRDLWACDLELRGDGAYAPFVRLALARYQPNSLPGVHLSQVVLADIVQTAPDRILTVFRNAATPDHLNVTLSGVSYGARRDPAPPADEEISGQSQVVAAFETRDPRIADDVLGWVPLETSASETQLGRGPIDEQGVATWFGQMAVPPEANGRQLRVVVKEYEEGFTPPLTPAQTYRPARRMVYAETVELPAGAGPGAFPTPEVGPLFITTLTPPDFPPPGRLYVAWSLPVAIASAPAGYVLKVVVRRSNSAVHPQAQARLDEVPRIAITYPTELTAAQVQALTGKIARFGEQTYFMLTSLPTAAQRPVEVRVTLTDPGGNSAIQSATFPEECPGR